MKIDQNGPQIDAGSDERHEIKRAPPEFMFALSVEPPLKLADDVSVVFSSLLSQLLSLAHKRESERASTCALQPFTKPINGNAFSFCESSCALVARTPLLP